MPELRQREPRILDPKYLVLIRQMPCTIRPCQRHPIEAAHIRFGRLDVKRSTGFGERPSDRWALPLCWWHHRFQHRNGEQQWWSDRGIDPIELAQRVYAAYEAQHTLDAMLDAMVI